MVVRSINPLIAVSNSVDALLSAREDMIKKASDPHCGAYARRAANTARRTLFRTGAFFDTRRGTETAYLPGVFLGLVHRTMKNGVLVSCCQRAPRSARVESRLLRGSIGKRPIQQVCGAPVRAVGSTFFALQAYADGEESHVSVSASSSWVDTCATLLYTSTPPAQNKIERRRPRRDRL